jgi:hypothetical protein
VLPGAVNDELVGSHGSTSVSWEHTFA